MQHYTLAFFLFLRIHMIQGNEDFFLCPDFFRIFEQFFA